MRQQKQQLTHQRSPEAVVVGSAIAALVLVAVPQLAGVEASPANPSGRPQLLFLRSLTSGQEQPLELE